MEVKPGPIHHLLIGCKEKFAADKIRSRFARRNGFLSVNSTDNLDEAKVAAKSGKVLLVLEDKIKGVNGLDDLEMLHDEQNHCYVLLLTDNAEREYVCEIKQRRFLGCLWKEHSYDELSPAIEVVMRIGRYFSAIFVPVDTERPKILPKYLPAFNNCDSRLLELVCKGKKDKEIAEILHVTYGTERKYKYNMRQKVKQAGYASVLELGRKMGLVKE